jgi:hypothetical protein
MRAVGVVVACAAGCGRIDFDVASDAPLSCSAFGDWGTPELVTELSTPGTDWGGQLTPDGLAYYFHSDGSGSAMFYVARRPHRSAPFDPPVAAPEIDATNFGDPTITGDELEMYVSGYVKTSECVTSYTRTSKSASWGNPTRLDALCAAGTSGCPYVTADGLTLYYNDSVSNHIAVSTRATRADPFPAGTPITSLYTGIGCPALSADQLSIYYDGGGPVSTYVSTRPSLTSPFDPNGMSVFGTPTADNMDSSITADGVEIMFASDRPGGPGKWDLYRVTRACL